jgi:hypothetical protein
MKSGLEANINIIKLQYAPAVDTAEKVKKIFDMGGPTAAAAAAQQQLMAVHSVYFKNHS